MGTVLVIFFFVALIVRVAAAMQQDRDRREVRQAARIRNRRTLEAEALRREDARRVVAQARMEAAIRAENERKERERTDLRLARDRGWA